MLRGLAWVLLGLVALLVAAVFVVHSSPFESWLRARLERQVGEHVRGRFSIGSLDLKWFGDLALRRVTVSDEQGREVVALDALELDIDYGALLGKTVRIERLAIDGLRLRLSRDAQGLLNLEQLFDLPKRERPEPRSEEPPDLKLQLAELHISELSVTLREANRTQIRVEHFGLDGSLEAAPADEVVRIELPRITAELGLDEPAMGLRVGLRELHTGVHVSLERGSGTAELSATHARAHIERRGAPTHETDIDLQPLRVELAPGSVQAELGRLVASALAIDSLKIHGGTKNGVLAGEQGLELAGLRIDAARLNALLGKPLLASDIEVATSVGGPPGAIATHTTVSTAGGQLAVDGTLDLARAELPRYDLSLLAHDVRTDELLLLRELPPVVLEHLRVGARGSGRDPHQAEIDLGLHARGLKVRGHTVDEVLLAARLDGGVLQIAPLMIDALGSRLWLRGWVDVDGGLIDAQLTIEGDVGAVLGRLRQAGLKIRTRLPPGALRLAHGTVVAHLSGEVQGLLRAELDVRDLTLAGGKVNVAARAELLRASGASAGTPVTVQSVDGKVELVGLSIGQLAALAGRRIDDISGDVSAELALSGTLQAPRLDYRVHARVKPSRPHMPAKNDATVLLDATGKTSAHALSLALDIEGQHGPARIELLSLEAELPLSTAGGRPGIAPNGPMHIELLLPRRSVADLLPYLPERLVLDPHTGKPRALPLGVAFVRLDVDGTPARPDGRFDVDVELPAMGEVPQRLTLAGTIEPAGNAVRVGTNIEGWLDPNGEPALEGRAVLDLSRSPLLGGQLERWSLELHLLPQQLASLPLPQARLLGLQGNARADIELHGSRADVLGKVAVELGGVRTKRAGPIDAAVHAHIEPAELSLDTDVKVGGRAVLQGRGGLSRGGRGLLAALQRRRAGASLAATLGNPTVHYQLTVPNHPLATHGALRPDLAELPGEIDGDLSVGGRLAAPTATGSLRYHHFPTLDGREGKVRVDIDAGTEQLGLALDLGRRPSADAAAPIHLRARLPRAALRAYLAAKRCHATTPNPAVAAGTKTVGQPPPCPDGSSLPITLHARAAAVPLPTVVPAFAVRHHPMKLAGIFDWTLDGDLLLDPRPRYALVAGTRVRLPPVSPDSTAHGALTLRDGLVSIPGTRRKLHDVEVRLRLDTRRIGIEALSLRESDLQHQGRKLDLHGALDLDHGRPRALRLQLDTDQWLLFGHEKLGPADAPRGTLTMHAEVTGDLMGAIKKVDVDVGQLELMIPNRFRRAHQPEVASKGDIIFLDESGQPAGKLPVATAAEAGTPGNDANSHAVGALQGDDRPAPAAAPAAAQSGLDLRVHMDRPVHVLQYPMDLRATGAIAVSRRGARRHIDGALEIVDGDLSLGGRKHRIVEGRLVFSDEAPGGYLDLLFARREHDAALRDVSDASAGQRVTIRLEGPIIHRETTLGGAGSPGTLYDLLSIHNAGRPRYRSAPDMPASFTVDYPQHLNLLLLSYLSVNVPHLLFLDRIDAWSDPYDERGTSGYSRMRHYHAELYNQSESLRLRAIGRPRGAGQSTAEVDLDWLWASTPQLAVGAGLGAGSRLGGGPGIFLEWSSKD